MTPFAQLGQIEKSAAPLIGLAGKALTVGGRMAGRGLRASKPLLSDAIRGARGLERAGIGMAKRYPFPPMTNPIGLGQKLLPKGMQMGRALGQRLGGFWGGLSQNQRLLAAGGGGLIAGNALGGGEQPPAPRFPVGMLPTLVQPGGYRGPEDFTGGLDSRPNGGHPFNATPR